MEIIATKREILGKKSKRLRKEYKIPAVVYGAGIESVPIIIGETEFRKVYQEAGDTNVIDLVLEGGKTYKVMVKEIQLHHINLQPTHVNFYQVNLTKKTTAEIPIEIIGEEECEIVKGGEGLVLQLLSSVEVEALPTDFPDAFKVDISTWTEIDQGLTVGELEFDKSKVEIVGLEDDELVVKIDHAQAEEEEEDELTEEEAIAAMEASGEKSKEEEEETEE